MATITRPQLPRMVIIPRADLDELPVTQKLLTLLSEQNDFVRANYLAEAAYMEPQNALTSLRMLEKKGLVISRKDGAHKSAAVSFKLIEAQ